MTSIEQLMSEGLIDMATAAAMLPPSRGRPRDPKTVKDWHNYGAGGFFLEAVRIPPGPRGQLFTTRAALARFFARRADPARPTTWNDSAAADANLKCEELLK